MLLGIVINGELIGDRKSNNDASPHNTYFGKLGIVNTHQNLRIKITTKEIILQQGIKQIVFNWMDKVILQQPR